VTAQIAAEAPSMAFGDVLALLEPLGFRLERLHGDQRIYRHPDVPQPFSLQPEDGKARPDEMRELLGILDRYDLPGAGARGTGVAR